MTADRKLNETRKAAYASMGLCTKEAMTSHTPFADRIRSYAQEDGIEAWDLVCQEYANGATGGTMAIVAFTPEGGRQTAVIIDPTDSREEVRAKFQTANGKAVTATGRPYRHAASPESMAKLRATSIHSATGATGTDPVPTMLFGKLIHFNPDGSITWSKA